MLGRLNHVALAVPNLALAVETYRGTLGASVSDPIPLPEHGVTVVFIDVGNTKIELLEPLGEASTIASFSRRTHRAACIMSATRWTISLRPATG